MKIDICVIGHSLIVHPLPVEEYSDSEAQNHAEEEHAGEARIRNRWRRRFHVIGLAAPTGVVGPA